MPINEGTLVAVGGCVIGHMDGVPGPAVNMETGVVTQPGEPLPDIPAQPGSTPLTPASAAN